MLSLRVFISKFRFYLRCIPMLRVRLLCANKNFLLTYLLTLSDVILAGLAELGDEQDNPAARRLASFQRPPADTDHLYVKSGKRETLVEHPTVAPDSRRNQRPDNPIVHFGVVATGDVRDHQQRQYHLEQNDVRAFDAGFSAVLESVEGNRKDSFIAVKGVCDYGDGTSADGPRGDVEDTDWRPYTALTAAGVMRCVVLGIVAPSDDDDDDDYD